MTMHSVVNTNQFLSKKKKKKKKKKEKEKDLREFYQNKIIKSKGEEWVRKLYTGQVQN